MQGKHTKRICAVCGEGVVPDQTCQKWFAKLRVADFSLDDAPQLCRSDELGSDQFDTLIENNQHYTTWEIANILIISKSIKLLVNMKNVAFTLRKNHMGFLANPIILSHLISSKMRCLPSWLVGYFSGSGILFWLSVNVLKIRSFFSPFSCRLPMRINLVPPFTVY